MKREQDTLIISRNGEDAFRGLLAETIEQKYSTINAELGRPDQGLAKLVLTLIELLRRLLEQEALRQVDRNQLTEAQIENLGCAFEQLEQKIHELQETFGLSDEDLNLDLGPLGTLL